MSRHWTEVKPDTVVYWNVLLQNSWKTLQSGCQKLVYYQWETNEVYPKKVVSPYFEVMCAVSNLSKWFDVIWSVLNRAWSWVDTVVYWKVLFENSSKTFQSTTEPDLGGE